jgi:carbon storage regulator
MLIFTRKLGESIHIGNNIEIIALDGKPNQVRTGIAAPDDIEIWRDEIYEKAQAKE